MKINLIHMEMTEAECYENVKRLHKTNPDVFMDPKKWKEERERRK